MGVKERKEREKEFRRNQILDAAEEIFFSDQFESATMDDIADRAELSKGTLYLYFRNKDDMMLGLHHRGMIKLSELMAVIAKSSENGLKQVEQAGYQYIRFAEAYPHYFDLMVHTDMKALHQQYPENQNLLNCQTQGGEAIGYLVTAIQRGQADGSIRLNLNPLVLAIQLWGSLTGLIEIASTNKVSEHPLFKGIHMDDVLSDFIQQLKRTIDAHMEGS